MCRGRWHGPASNGSSSATYLTSWRRLNLPSTTRWTTRWRLSSRPSSTSWRLQGPVYSLVGAAAAAEGMGRWAAAALAVVSSALARQWEWAVRYLLPLQWEQAAAGGSGLHLGLVTCLHL